MLTVIYLLGHIQIAMSMNKKRAAPVHEAPALRGVRRRVGPLGVFVRSLSLQFLQEAVSTT
jgi:hypothetical protein